MQTNSKLQRFLDWRYWACWLPFLGLVLVGFYLALFTVYRCWRIGLTASKPTDVSDFYFRILSGLLHNLGDPRSAEIYKAITAKHVVVWGYGTGLVGLSLFFAIVISGYVIFKALRGWTNREKWVFTGCILLFCLVIYPFISRALGVFNNFTVIPRQFWGLIRYQLTAQYGMRDIVNIEMLVVAIGYSVSTLLAFASAATLWPMRELETPDSSTKPRTIDDGAKYLYMQMKHLRFILYVGAILLVVITFRHRMTLNWALEYLKPVPLLESHPTYKYASLIFGHLEILTSNIVLATSVLNTLLLAALYVPSALMLQRRAYALSRLAVDVESEPKKEIVGKDSNAEEQGVGVAARQEAWLRSRNLIFPFKEQLPKVIAILSPLLAGPLGEVLNFFK
jgi:hypothetical protein